MKVFKLFIIAVVLALIALPAVCVPFADVADDAVYYGAVTELAKEYELGYPDNTFRPESKITRAEFVVLAIKLSDEYVNWDEVRNEQVFADVPTSYWASKYITYAYDMGIITGYNDSTFNPKGHIKVVDMAKIFAYLKGYNKGSEMEYPKDYLALAEVFGLKDMDKDTIALRWQAVCMIYNAKNLEKEATLSWAKADDVAEPFFEAVHYDSIADTGVMGPVGPVGATGATGATGPSTLSVDKPSSAKPIDEGIVGIISEEKREGIKPGTLTAGKWADLDNWGNWQDTMEKNNWSKAQSKWNIPLAKYEILVLDGKEPVMGAKIEFYDNDNMLWSAVTDNRGRAILIFNDSVDIQQSRNLLLYISTTAEELVIEDLVLSTDKPYEVNMKKGNVEDSVDVMFVVDTTGSMWDELEYLKIELNDIITRIPAENVRVSCNFYRDIGDEYVVRPFPFTKDISVATKQISEQRATGGGDTPEAVEMALLDAIDGHEWNADAKERFLFLVLDAPPHHTADIVNKMNYCVKTAAEKGIRIVPVASSGIDKETEFLLRSMAIATNGIYVFLTDHSGVGNSHIEPSGVTYSVEFLNELLLQIIKERL